MSSLQPYLLLLGVSSSLAVYLAIRKESSKKPITNEKEIVRADERIHTAPEYCLPLHLIGKSIKVVPTPALILELEDYEHNLATLKKTLYDNKCDNVKVRAHFKAHKCPQIAYQQVTFGSCIGMCCQKISEAVALIESQHQVDDVFISNQIVDPAKLERLVRLALLHDRKVKLSATVDDIEGKFDTCGLTIQLLKQSNKYAKNKYQKIKKHINATRIQN